MSRVGCRCFEVQILPCQCSVSLNMGRYIMNIFYLDEDITLCARYHCDSHVVKMILESVQILCTVLSKNKVSAPYRPTHKNHSCFIWAGESLENWIWLRNLVFELNKEFQYRFDHNSPHKSVLVSNSLALPPIPAIGITERPQAMPEIYKILGDPITAYRQYYVAEKGSLLKYTKRPVPEWALNMLTKK